MPEAVPEDLAVALASSADRRGAFGQPLIFLSSTGSTNDVAQRLADNGAPHGAVVIALAQTAGRGRQGREWFSPPGAGLYMSVLIRNAAIAPLLTLAGGVAVADGIRRATGLPAAIKWPNDIVVRDAHAPGRRRKLAGILAEGSTADSGVQHVVVGIGINVRPADYPPALVNRVTSLERELGRPVDAGLVASEILVALNEQVTALESGRRSEVLDRWRSLSPSAVGGQVWWSISGETIAGTTAGIDGDGALLVRSAGATHRIISGEVRWE
jgi:BirA family transcriptional regulator, biotin operon repressor / biotin---[acetyl-CoA-carboxylase] ligase